MTFRHACHVCFTNVCILTATELCALLSLINYACFFLARRENEHWKTKKRRDKQMQVRRPNPVVFGIDF